MPSWRTIALVMICIVLLVSAIGTASTFAQEAVKEEKVVRLAYEHKGRMDYVAYLKPSYLFGPEPQEPVPLPPNPRYPIAIVEGIDMSFVYEGSTSEAKEIEIRAVLGSEGLWEKSLVLKRRARFAGSPVTVRFQIDIQQITELYDLIEKEINIAAGREVTVVADVTDGGQQFGQGIKLKFTRSVIEIASERAKQEQNARGIFEYTIRLKPNSIYDKPTIEAPPIVATSAAPLTKVNPGTVLLTELVESLDFSFRYSFESTKPLTNLTEDLTVEAILEGTKVWQKRFTLVPRAQFQGPIHQGFAVDLTSLKELLGKIRREAGAAADSYPLTLQATVLTTAESPEGKISDSFLQTLTADLGKPVLTWQQDLSKSKTGSLSSTRKVPNASRVMGFSLSAGRVVFPLTTVMLLLAGLLVFVWVIRERRRQIVSIDREHQSIRRRLGSRMAEATAPLPLVGGPTIQVASMDELVKIANETGKPIIHGNPKDPGQRHSYLVFDGTITYQYSPRNDRNTDAS